MKVLIANKDFEQWSVGDIIRGPSNNEDELKGYPYSSGVGVIVEVPVDVDLRFLKTFWQEPITGVTEKWTKEGFEDRYTQPKIVLWVQPGQIPLTEEPDPIGDWDRVEIPDDSWSYVPNVSDVPGAWKVVEDTEKKIKAQVQEANTAMDSQIREAATAFFGTPKENAQFAYINSLMMRVTFPQMYVGKGLKALWNMPGYAPGDPLSTLEDIQTYYGLILEDLVDLDLFRDQKIWEYLATKTVLES